MKHVTTLTAPRAPAIETHILRDLLSPVGRVTVSASPSYFSLALPATGLVPTFGGDEVDGEDDCGDGDLAAVTVMAMEIEGLISLPRCRTLSNVDVQRSRKLLSALSLMVRVAS